MKEFGKTPAGESVARIALTNGRVSATVLTFGAIVSRLLVQDRHGVSADVVLGFDTLEDYLTKNGPYFGATIGRVANRVAGGEFQLDGKRYSLAVNNGRNALHGGLKGFDKKVWTIQEATPNGRSVTLGYRSPDGEEGYPGNLAVTVTFSVTDDDALRLDYAATTDAATPVNLTNHSYFNLAGAGSGDVLGHEVMIAADRYTPVDEMLIPTGAIASVGGTPLDFTTPTPIGARIEQVGGDPVGYDHNYVIREEGSGARLAARVREPGSGRVLEMFTTEPGVQLYTGNFLDGSLRGKGGVSYGKHQGFCLEAQHFPDSVNQATFPSIVLEPGAAYSQTTIYRFSAS